MPGENSSPEVSVIIPSIDGWRDGNVPRLISQIKDQTFKNLEIIVIKGVSPNGRARNQGAKQARGNIFIFFDDDIQLGHRRVIANLVATMKKEDRMGLLGVSKVLSPHSNAFQKRAAREIPRALSPVYRKTTDGDLVDHVCLTIWRDLFFKIGGENEELIRGTDPALRHRIRQAGYRVAIAADSWAYHPLPENVFKLVRLFFGNGAGSAWVWKHYPKLAFHDAPSHRTPFRAQSSLPFRMLTSLSMLLKAIFRLHFIYLFSRLAYGAGYLWGFLTGWTRERGV